MREAELLADDRWSREDLLAFQRERLRALIAHAVSYSSYYREVLGADAADRPLAEQPTLPKATLMAEFGLRDALVTAISSTGAIPPAVDVRQVPALDREPGGKIRLVRSA